jgi:Fic family protein
VGGYEGAPVDKIEECMNSLFEFANNENSKREHGLLLPHICHYYILYVHPYFDYNGRTARMVSLWLSVLNNIFEDPIFISEAINEHKNEYYKAIINTRTSENDLTYFLGYILESSIKFSLIYKNLEEINQKLAQNGEFMPPAEQIYLKKILIHNTDSYFNYKMFLVYINNNMSKVGAFKVLNHLNKLGVLEKKINSKKETIFKVNTEFLAY